MNGFPAIDRTVESRTRSPKMDALGGWWIIDVYPGGETEEEAGRVSLFLHWKGDWGQRLRVEGYCRGWHF